MGGLGGIRTFTEPVSRDSSSIRGEMRSDANPLFLFTFCQFEEDARANPKSGSRGMNEVPSTVQKDTFLTPSTLNTTEETEGIPYGRTFGGNQHLRVHIARRLNLL